MATTTGDSPEISVREAGRRGGAKTSEIYGREFYQAIGKKGGRTGGKVTRERYGIEFYQEIGRKGGTRKAGDE